MASWLQSPGLSATSVSKNVFVPLDECSPGSRREITPCVQSANKSELFLTKREGGFFPGRRDQLGLSSVNHVMLDLQCEMNTLVLKHKMKE